MFRFQNMKINNHKPKLKHNIFSFWLFTLFGDLQFPSNYEVQSKQKDKPNLKLKKATSAHTPRYQNFSSQAKQQNKNNNSSCREIHLSMEWKSLVNSDFLVSYVYIERESTWSCEELVTSDKHCKTVNVKILIWFWFTLESIFYVQWDFLGLFLEWHVDYTHT